MRRILMSVLVFALVIAALPASAQSMSIRAAAAAAGTAMAAQQTAGAVRNPGRPWIWSGVALLAGGTVMSILASTALKSNDCGAAADFYGDFVVACVEQRNEGLLWAGIGAASTGSTLLAIGAQKAVTMGPLRVNYHVSW